tara:strand:- start:3 stop:701 length:699 start_codon:yes stop_codon:yes gene_type:complete
MSKPYKEQIEGNIKYREFDPKVETNELVWHRDRENRTITVLEGKGWFFQMDNEIPKEMCAGDILEVKKMDYHRLYKSGTTPLKISIEEKYMQSFREFTEAKSEKELDIKDLEQMIKKPDPSRFKQYGGKAKYVKMLKSKLAKLEETSIEEASYPIDIKPWQFSHGAKQPKEKANWIFDYEASISSGGSIGLQKDTFIAKAGSSFKNAAKQLFNFLQKDLKVKPKDVRIKLAP